ncbi:hypothetical protein OH492_14540 [Vibrio chagasii]|nr:hypothetical protein [Vibrio chagasii]
MRSLRFLCFISMGTCDGTAAEPRVGDGSGNRDAVRAEVLHLSCAIRVISFTCC